MGKQTNKTYIYIYICCLKETHFTCKNTHRLKIKGLKKIFQANKNEKRAGVAIFISDKIDFKTKTVTKRKRSLYNGKEVIPTIGYTVYKYLCT